MRKARLSRTNFIRTMPERRERKGACGSKARLVARGLRATELLAGRGGSHLVHFPFLHAAGRAELWRFPLKSGAALAGREFWARWA